MKQCQKCNRTYSDEAIAYCLYDGTPLTAGPQVGPAPILPSLNMPSTPGFTPPAVAPQPTMAPAPQQSGPNIWGRVAIVVIVLFLANRIWGHHDGQTIPPAHPSIQGQPGGGGEAPGTPIEGNAPSADEATLKEVEETIRQADDAEAQALHSHDYTELANYYSGAAYKQAVAALTKLQQPNVEINATLQGQDFNPETFRVAGTPPVAQLHATEQWNLFVRNTQTGRSATRPLNSSATYYLEHKTDHW